MRRWSNSALLRECECRHICAYAHHLPRGRWQTLIIDSLGRRATFLLSAAFFCVPLSAQTLNEQQELVASLTNGVGSGKSVSISGNTAVVGVPGDNGGAGDVYVFTRSGTTWTQQVVLTASDATAGDKFGTAVSISGTSLAVGAPGRGTNKGAVYVFTFDGTNWNQNATVLTTGASGDKLGSSVSIQGFTVAAGAPYATSYGTASAGDAVIFRSSNNGSTWSPSILRRTKGQNKSGLNFGTSVSLAGSTVLIGSPFEKVGSKAAVGQTYVFVSAGGVWSQQTRFSPAGLATNANFGASVSLYVDTAVIGAPGTTRGNAYVYTRSGTTWSPVTTTPLFAGANSGDNYGASVAVSGSGIVVGAPLATNAGAASGRAYEYTLLSGSTYATNELIATNNATGDNFGASIAIDAGYALVGAPVASASTGSGNGAAYVFAPPPASVTTTTVITSFNPDVPTNIGQTSPVNVTVSAGLGVPSGSVDIDDGVGDTCTATLTAGSGGCTLTNSTSGPLLITANYPGAGAFLPSSAQATHVVNGNRLVFMPAATPNVLQGDQLNGVSVEVHDGSDALVTSDNSTQITVAMLDPCDPNGVLVITFGTVTATGGIADFTNIGPRFYTGPTTGGTYQLSATAVATPPVTPGNSGTFDVVSNAVDAPIHADGFESCSL